MRLTPLLNARRYVQTILGIVFRHPLTGVSIIACPTPGSLVLVRRRDNGQWAIPGGLVDWGENIVTSVRRELLEETGLTLVSDPQIIGVYSAPDRDPRLHSICIAVKVLVEGEIQIHDQLEIIEGKVFTSETIPWQNLAHDHAQQLQDYLSGQTWLR
jgi:ADP-ribose pyrophosphatase YjhB (NUDIX family)